MRKHFPLDPTSGIENAALLPWSDGVPNTGTEGSFPGQALVVDSESEILAAVDAAGLSRSGTDLTQLAQAMSIGLFLGTFGGTANTLTATLPTLGLQADGVTPSKIPALVPGMRFHGLIGPSANTGAATFNLSGFVTAPGAKPLVKNDGSTALQSGDLKANGYATLVWDGTSFRVASVVPSDILALIQTNAPAAVAASPYAGTRNVVPITTSQLWAVPAGVTYLKRVRLWGGGGGGGLGSGTAGAGSGGGGAGYAEYYNVGVTPGQNIPITIGAGGSAGVSGSQNGGAGTTTSLGSVFSATGGGGGTAGINGLQTSTAGAGGTTVNGMLSFNAPGGSFAYSVGTPCGGIGGSSGFGGSNPTLNVGTAGNAGVFPGGGANGGANNGNGGVGAPGLCIIEY